MDDDLNKYKEEENNPLIDEKPQKNVYNSFNVDNSENEKQIENNKNEEENSKYLINFKVRIKNDLTDNGENSRLLKEDNQLIKANDTKIDVSFVVEKNESKESKKAAIISLYELPKYKNFFITVHPFIIHGYRIHHSFPQCLKSIFTIHNETMNIWTHLIPFFIFFGVFIYNLLENSFKHYLIIYLFLFTTFIFLLFSCIHHTFNCHSNEVWQCCYKMDLLGIMFQLVTATICTLQFMFHEYDQIRQIYAYSFLFLSFTAIILSMFDFFISSKFNLFLMFSYAVLFLISFLSCIHWIAIAKMNEVESVSTYILIGFLFIFLGFAIFLAKFPECIFQHKFIDYYFNSHIIWHLCVVGTAVCYYLMLNKYYSIVINDE